MNVACVSCGRPCKPGPRCDACRSASPANERPYDDAAWRRVSATFLRKNKWCVLCRKEGRHEPATVADHYPRTRKELLAANDPNPDAEKHLRAICRRHHASHGRRTTMRFTNDPA